MTKEDIDAKISQLKKAEKLPQSFVIDDYICNKQYVQKCVGHAIEPFLGKYNTCKRTLIVVWDFAGRAFRTETPECLVPQPVWDAEKEVCKFVQCLDSLFRWRECDIITKDSDFIDKYL